MPKKTKKEKIIAELRRRLEITKAVGQKWEIGNEKLDNEVRSEIPINQNIPPQFPASHVSLPSSYVVHDLRKTFILTGLAISFEIVVYWITELGGSKLLKFLPIK